MITFYDIPCVDGPRPFSSNTLKTRFSLNYKGLPFETEWIEYCDMEALYQKFALAPARIDPDGRAVHSLPLIKDNSSGQDVFVADSLEIAKYLDKTYPDTPRLIPISEDGKDIAAQFQAFEIDWFMNHALSFAPVLFKEVQSVLSQRGWDFFKVVRAVNVNAVRPDRPISNLDELELSAEEKKEAWSKFKASFDFLDDKFGGKGNLTWYFGDDISFADFMVAGLLVCVKIVVGENSDDWKEILALNDGKWKLFLERLEKYL
ncbi:hypothetical protein FA15DRAFT_664564 [Coprinopsis marcescibilis]|uniref:GST N-terminal domain-containing protein n=1 Tax=Coprinopsis marcescibilis TaxID=230819 RepID=A0A5C3L851_COPMA|nr:hypothetical protein FA15DRAFT_664564 [Coprinopsis marcescibilis]